MEKDDNSGRAGDLSGFPLEDQGELSVNNDEYELSD
jgi:hypothetical protein